MKYKNIKEGIFVSRPNRFIAKVLLDGKEEAVHVKNTGRCKELLTQGARVFLEKSDNPKRKTQYDIVSVYKGDVLYNIDSQVVNTVLGEYICTMFDSVTFIKPECRYKNSRFDFYVEYEGKKAFVEVKGVTLEKDGVMLFLDAPTERGVKHINELCECIKDGYEAYIVFVIQADAGEYFTPNHATHKAFADALKTAKEKGVKILAYKCRVDKESIEIKDTIKAIV